MMKRTFSLSLIAAFACGTIAFGQNARGVDDYDFDLRVKYQAKPTPDSVELLPPMTSSVRIDSDRKTGRIDPMLMGYNIEDINHAFYPGLYAQMLWDESFEDEPNQPLPEGWTWHAEPLNDETPKDDRNLRRWRGAWAFEDGAVYLAGCRQRRIMTDLFRFDDAVVEVETRQALADRTVFWGPSLLLCWGDDEYLSLQISYDRGVVELRRGGEKRGVNVIPLVASEKCGWLAFDRWTKVKAVVRKEGTVSVWIDGRKALEYSGEPLKPGGLGLDATFTNAWFRNLKAVSSDGRKFAADFRHIDRAPYNHGNHISKWWNPVEQGSAKGVFAWSGVNPYNTNRSQMMTYKSGKGRFGMSNSGLRDWGLTVRRGWTYTGRIYLRGDCRGGVIVALQSGDGSKSYAEQRLGGVGKDWQRFDFELTASDSDTTARFAVMLDAPGTVYVDQAVLLPDARGLYKGLPFRKDLAEKLTAGMGHLRFGGDMINQKGFADWKTMLLEPDRRRQYLDGWSYHKSAQFMIFEFLDFCKAAGVEPIPNFDAVPAREVADFVEYCNGDGNTAWGRKRIESGRSEPYGIRYLMIGNGMPSPGEIEEIAELVHGIDPGVKIIAGDMGHTRYHMDANRDNRAFDRFTDKTVVALSSRPEIELLSDGAAWGYTIDKFREIFPHAVANGVRLYAEEVNGATHNMQRGLVDALFTMTSERNCDVVAWQSYCNAFQAEGNLYEWDQGHIFFNSSRSWYQPSGWVVKLLGEYYRPNRVESSVETFRVGLDMAKDKGPSEHIDHDALTVTATMSDDGKELIVKVVNIYPGEIKTDISIPGSYIGSLESVTIGSRRLKGINPAGDPNRIVPQCAVVPDPCSRMSYTFAPMSFTILKYKLQ